MIDCLGLTFSICRVTHNDPFEDTESCFPRQRCAVPYAVSPTTIPFEDTESYSCAGAQQAPGGVSPTTIRSRILKETPRTLIYCRGAVSPTTIRSRILKGHKSLHANCIFRLVSPTTIRSRILKGNAGFFPFVPITVSPTTIRSRILKVFLPRGGGQTTRSFTHNDPFEDTESDGKTWCWIMMLRFTHNDPFEDTERYRNVLEDLNLWTFHPQRSVRGY